MLKVRGRTYDSPAELADAIAATEAMRDDEVDELRARGADAQADARADVYGRELNAMRATLRTANEKAAAGTEQPADRPKRRRPARGGGGSSRARARGGGRSIERGSDRVGRELVRPARRDVGRFTRSAGLAPYTGGAADIAWAVIGMAVGLTVVYALLQGRGPAAVEAIVGGADGALRRFMDPGDPFLLPKGAAPAQRSAPAPASGNVRVPGGGTDGAVNGGSILDSLVRGFGLIVTDVNTPGEHVDGSYHYQKDRAGRARARDVKPNAGFQRLAAWARNRPKLFREFYGPMGWHIEDGVLYEGAYPNHDDHGHIAI